MEDHMLLANQPTLWFEHFYYHYRRSLTTSLSSLQAIVRPLV